LGVQNGLRRLLHRGTALSEMGGRDELREGVFRGDRQTYMQECRTSLDSTDFGLSSKVNVRLLEGGMVKILERPSNTASIP